MAHKFYLSPNGDKDIYVPFIQKSNKHNDVYDMNWATLMSNRSKIEVNTPNINKDIKVTR